MERSLRVINDASILHTTVTPVSRRRVPYSGETVYAQLPSSRSLDEFDGLSVWCVPVGISFGDGRF